jgi:hypothetical protein
VGNTEQLQLDPSFVRYQRPSVRGGGNGWQRPLGSVASVTKRLPRALSDHLANCRLMWLGACTFGARRGFIDMT